MRMGCLSELVSGIDKTYTLTYGGAELAWLFPNKCESKSSGFCFDIGDVVTLQEMSRVESFSGAWVLYN